jgi:hypothetical protein
MSITVVTARDEYGAPSTREVYEEGVKFVNDNGNLDILTAKPQLIATYGSGNWLSVHLGDSVTVITKTPDESSDDSSDDSSDFDFSFGDDDSDSDTSDDSDSDSDTSDDSDSDTSDDDTAVDDSDTSDDDTAVDDSDTSDDDSETTA